MLNLEEEEEEEEEVEGKEREGVMEKRRTSTAV